MGYSDRQSRSMSMRRQLCHGMGIAALFFVALSGGPAMAASEPEGYLALVKLFQQWREFEHPVMKNNVPDYSARAMADKAAALPRWRTRLQEINPQSWTIEQQNDYKLVKAEMNGLDFNLRVLRPWARDPSFYVNTFSSRSDVPSREAPVSYPEIELYNYRFPLDADAQRELTIKLKMIPAFLAEAKENLTGSNARDLWVYGEEELRNQSRVLATLESGTLTVRTLAEHQHADLTGTSQELRDAVTGARKATDELVAWLEKFAASKTGLSGVGEENYTWYQQNVHFIPYTWDEEVVLLRRELERAQSALRLEEHHNRNLPPLEPAADASVFDKMVHDRLDKFVDFLVKQEIIPDKPYIQLGTRGRARSIHSAIPKGLLHSHHTPRAYAASVARLSLDRPGADARRTESKPYSPPGPALKHLGQSLRGFCHGLRRANDARRTLRRQSSRKRARLDHASEPCRSWPCFALRSGQPIYLRAGRRVSGRMDARVVGPSQTTRSPYSSSYCISDSPATVAATSRARCSSTN